MGKKKNKNQDQNQNQNQNSSDGQTKENNDAAANKVQNAPNTVVLKVDLHCEGCATKIMRFLNCFPGVETVKVDDDSGKVTITGKVDPVKLRDKLAEKSRKKVDLISPQPKKDGNKKPDDKSDKKNDDKKSKEPQQSTAVLKMALHCQGCIERIRKTVSKTRGIKELTIDKDKDTVTVKGTMDVKALVEILKERLKRKVEVVPPKKDKDKDKDKGKDNNKDNDNENDDNEGEKEGGGGKGGGKKKGGGQKAGEEAGHGGGGRMEQSRMDFMFPPPYPYGYGYYGPIYYMEPPQMFSDENPNACSIM